MIARHLVPTLMLLAWLVPKLALGAQTAQVTTEHAEVHEHPTIQSQLITTLDRFTTVPASSQMAKDNEGTYWYKVLLPQGGFGYIRANDVLASDIKNQLNAAGIATNGLKDKPTQRDPWNFTLRLMGMAGTDLGSPGLELSPDLEFSMNFPLANHGFMQHMLAVGATFLNFNESVLALSIILKLFQRETVWEPEIRVRAGNGLSSELVLLGVSVGFDHPIANNFEQHFSWYVEGGNLMSIDARVAHIWLAGGIGYHF